MVQRVYIRLRLRLLSAVMNIINPRPRLWLLNTAQEITQEPPYRHMHTAMDTHHAVSIDYCKNIIYFLITNVPEEVLKVISSTSQFLALADQEQ